MPVSRSVGRTHRTGGTRIYETTFEGVIPNLRRRYHESTSDYIRNKIEEWLQAWTVFSTFVASSWWYLGMRGELPDDLCPSEYASQFDFVSFDYYFGVSALTMSHHLGMGRVRKTVMSITQNGRRRSVRREVARVM